MMQGRYYLQNCKAIMYLEKLPLLQNVNDLMFQVILVFSDCILIKQIIFFSPLSAVDENRF